jgi:pseudouridine kinase
VIEVDLDKEIVKATLDLAQKHGVKVFGLVSNMSIAAKRRDFLRSFDCFICNQLEAGLLFLDDYTGFSPEQMQQVLCEKVVQADIPAMVVTMGDQGAVFATSNGDSGICPARKVQVKDTTGAGDAFCAGVSIGLTYGKTMSQSIEIGSILAASVITSSENVCPRFQPAEFALQV